MCSYLECKYTSTTLVWSGLSLRLTTILGRITGVNGALLIYVVHRYTRSFVRFVLVKLLRSKETQHQIRTKNVLLEVLNRLSPRDLQLRKYICVSHQALEFMLLVTITALSHITEFLNTSTILHTSAFGYTYCSIYFKPRNWKRNSTEFNITLSNVKPVKTRQPGHANHAHHVVVVKKIRGWRKLRDFFLDNFRFWLSGRETKRIRKGREGSWFDHGEIRSLLENPESLTARADGPSRTDH